MKRINLNNDSDAQKGDKEQIQILYDDDEMNKFFSQDYSNKDFEFDPTPAYQQTEPQREWFVEDYEGQLSVDVFDAGDSVVIRAAIAGVNPEDLDIFVDNDMLTIRGKRESDIYVDEKNYYYQECYWGKFSRSILLPVDVNFDDIKASLKNGVLTIRLPKIEKKKKIDVEIFEE